MLTVAPIRSRRPKAYTTSRDRLSGPPATLVESRRGLSIPGEASVYFGQLVRLEFESAEGPDVVFQLPHGACADDRGSPPGIAWHPGQGLRGKLRPSAGGDRG